MRPSCIQLSSFDSPSFTDSTIRRQTVGDSIILFHHTAFNYSSIENTKLNKARQNKTEDCVSIKGTPPANRIHRHPFLVPRDLDLDPMTLIYEHDFDILHLYQNEFRVYDEDRSVCTCPFASQA